MTDDTPTICRKLGTWRSGTESPPFPGVGDARQLLRAVQVPPTATDCTLVRVRLADRNEDTLLDVRERLLAEDPVVGTTIGREAGPRTPGTFDIAVVPGRDPVSVGRAVAAVDEVVGVAAAAFGTDADAGEAASAPSPLDAVGTNGGGRPAGQPTRAADGDGRPDDLEILDAADDVGGLAALEDAPDGPHPGVGRSPDRERPGRPRPSGGRSHPDDRLADIEARVAALEERLDELAGSDADDPAERVDALAEAVADLERWRRRIETAPLDDRS